MNAIHQLLATLTALFRGTEAIAKSFENIAKVGEEKSAQFYEEAHIRRISERKALEKDTGVTMETKD